jgi:IS5 family transposase
MTKPMQATFAESGFEAYRKTTRREQFLAEMDRVVPWRELCALVEPVYPKGEGPGRPSVGIERMLRIHFLQHWYDLSDPAVEETLYDSNAMRRFVGIDLGRERAPDETTVCKFRHLLEEHGLGKRIFEEVGRYLQQQGFKLSRGTIVDATIISAPSSTKNKHKARDPEMHQTKKGNQWYFGMKAHIGVDAKEKLIHSAVATAANVADSTVMPQLLRGDETRVYGDKAYCGQSDTIREKCPNAKDFTQRKAHRNRPLTEQQEQANHTKSKTRSKVEHPFLVLKRVWGFAKVRYRGLMKNANRLFAACALANLFRVRKRLLRLQGA